MKKVLATILLLAWTGGARGDPPVEVAVVGVHVEDQADDAYIRVVEAIEATSGLTATPFAEVSTHLSGQGGRIVTKALQEPGLATLREGRLLFEQAELERASQRLAEAVNALQDSLAGGSDNRALTEALLLQASIALAMGDGSGASRSFKDVIRIDPRRTLDPVHFPPKMVQLFDEVRAQVMAVPTGWIELEGVDAEARVVVDGRKVGQGLQVIEDLPAGRHDVVITGLRGDRSHATLRVPPGGGALHTHAPELGWIGGEHASASERSRLTGELYSVLGEAWTDRLVLVAGQTDSYAVGLQFYEPRTGRFSVAQEGPSDGDPVGVLLSMVPGLEDLIRPDGSLRPDKVTDESISLDPNSNPVLAGLMFAPVQRRPKRVHWAVWASAGVVAVGATTAALLLASSAPGDAGADASTGSGTVMVRF